MPAAAEIAHFTAGFLYDNGAAGNIPEVYRWFGVEPADFKMAVLKTA